MAIKRVLLPVSGGASFEALSDVAFHIGEKFSAQVMGLFVQPPSLKIPYFDITGMEESRALLESVQQSRREVATKAESSFKSRATCFPHVDSVLRSVAGGIESVIRPIFPLG